MNARWILLALWPGYAAAQGFAGLGTDAEGFALPQPDPLFDFPADHGPHWDYRIEWWYLTAVMEGPDGTPYGLQWTLFRSALAPEEGVGWDAPQVWFGHAAVTGEDFHHVTERFARGGIGQAGVTADPFEAWIDDWRLAGPSFDDLTLSASGPDFAYEVSLEARGPLILHGEAGYSVKSDAGQASYYYAQPDYALTGTLTLPDGEVEVTGTGWLDREWSSQPLEADQTGWDWFALDLDDGAKLMLYRLRSADGSAWTAATHVAPDGTVTTVPDGAATGRATGTATVAGREVPVEWRLQWPDMGIDVTTRPLNPQAWMDVAIPYWEGPVIVDGSHTGRGYLEMTGYE
ncbi:lipocalin-like domain-containing protein [Wenxinia saemankumensis]|uniref:Predicted secreted hydrolase n=1 Tax=Wenxinia saemankumensis TaxID=1447782 RepID=A0A1M6ELR3_9RHOB|nr:lipocalin-like domain-containing protein [Wenxinia saemankumensis]SHI86451.1 Predicted secreted hydrolase [Wenxinia saemankumensis]